MLSTDVPKIRAAMPLPPLLKAFTYWSIVLTVITFADKAFCAFVLHLHGVYLQIVFTRTLLFVDFRCFMDRFRDFHHTTFFATDAAHGMVFTYPAPAALPYEFFYLFPHSLIVFLLAFLCGILAAAVVFRSVLVRYGLAPGAASFLILTVILCSYPLYVEVFLANIEIVIVFLVAGGIYLFIIGRSAWAAVCFGAAGAMKIFPLIFLALLFKRQQYRQIALGLAVVVFLQIFSLWLISSDVIGSVHGIRSGLHYELANYIVSRYKHDIGVDHSLWGLYKGGLVLADRPWPAFATMVSQLRLYVYCTAALGLALYVWRLRVLPILNNVLSLTVIGVLFTACSKDYTLLHLYVPFAMMILLAMENPNVKQEHPGLGPMFTCMCLLLAPLSEFVYNGLIFGAQIKAVVLSVLLVLGLIYPLKSRNTTSLYAPQG